LDRAAEAGGRDPGGELDRRVEVGRLVDEEAAERFLGRDERTVGRERLAVLHAHGRRRVGVLQAGPRRHARRLVDGLVVGVDLLLLVLRELGPFVGCDRGGRGALMDQQDVLQGGPPRGMGRPEERTATAEIDRSTTESLPARSAYGHAWSAARRISSMSIFFMASIALSARCARSGSGSFS